MALHAADINNIPRPLLVDSGGRLYNVISDGTTSATVTALGYLNVKTNISELNFAADYALAQAGVVILTPTAGKRIRVVQVYASTDDATTDITLSFTTSGNVIFKLYTRNFITAIASQLRALGAVNETITLTCGAKTFINIGYDEE